MNYPLILVGLVLLLGAIFVPVQGWPRILAGLAGTATIIAGLVVTTNAAADEAGGGIAAPSGKYKGIYLTPQDEVDEIYRLTRITQEVLDENGVGYFMVAGSVLGAVRHGGMIPWDDDVDFMTVDVEAVRNCREDFNARGLELTEHDLHVTAPHFKVWDKKSTKQQNGGAHTYPFVDIFSGTNTGTQIVPMLSKHAAANVATNLTMDRSEVYPIKKYRFGPLSLPGPAKAEQHLDRIFGPDWSTKGVQTHHHGNNAGEGNRKTVIDLSKTPVPAAVPLPEFKLRTMRGDVISSKEWEGPEQVMVSKILEDGDMVLQLGGHIGATCIFAEKYRNLASNVCMEPSDRAIATLRLNMEKNGTVLSEAVHAIVGDNCSGLKLSVDKKSNKMEGERKVTRDGSGEGQDVTCTPLREIQQKHNGGKRFNTLIFDCEGCAPGFVEENAAELGDVTKMTWEQDHESGNAAVVKFAEGNGMRCTCYNKHTMKECDRPKEGLTFDQWVCTT